MDMTQFVLMAILVESTVEYIVGEWLTGLNARWMRYIALAVGVAAAIIWNMDLLSVLGFQSTVPYVGHVATGLVIGRGSSFVHDFVTKYLPARE